MNDPVVAAREAEEQAWANLLEDPTTGLLRAYAAAVRATRDAEVAALVEEVDGMLINFSIDAVCPWCEQVGGDHLTGCSLLAVIEARGALRPFLADHQEVVE